VFQKQEQLDFAAQANMPLIAPSAIASLSAARHGHRANIANYDVNDASVMVAVAQAYFAAAGADELVVARKNAVEVARQTYENAKARVAAEVANQVDVTRAETALVRAEQDRVEAENVRATTYRTLATMLNLHEPFTLVLQAKPPAPTSSGPSAVAAAVRDRPELVAQRETIASAAQTERAALWRWLPTLSAFANVHAYNYAGFSGDKYSWAVGVELDWTIYDGGTRDAQRRQAIAQRREAEVRLDQLDDQISDEIANAAGTLETKQRGVASAEHSVALATETLRLVRAQYDAGTAKQLDVLQAQDSLVEAEVALAQAHFDAALADIQLRRATGVFPGKTTR
jgi:outer membrane protein TolC